MATQHLDLEEQEQLAQFKAFWARWGNALTWLVIVVLGAYAAWNGWQYHQRSQANQAAQLYGQLQVAAAAEDADKVVRVLQDMQDNVGGTALMTHARLLAAETLLKADREPAARAQLAQVLEASKDQGLRASAALRLAAMDLEAKAYGPALTHLNGDWPAAYQGLMDDRRGDVLMAQGERDAAVSAYQSAHAALEAGMAYRQMVAVKLNALGVAVKE